MGLELVTLRSRASQMPQRAPYFIGDANVVQRVSERE